ncbi:MAG: tRNA (guanosine(46)-N7)-methyltransferase TrmB [Clostridia bacterium]|nr:tRNA (guanosine(46)-N7)-methyltransferase TrmB [Clostridia bacterium]
MRMRKKKNLDARMEACAPWLVTGPEMLRGAWRARFGVEEKTPLELEIGCGKGSFITEMARQNPQRCFVAVERVESVLLMALEKAKEAGLQNVLFLSADAALLGEIFDTGEVDRIYLNFSDPWPPKRQHKRRLTHPLFLAVYQSVLQEGGEICFKTDNKGLFEDSICYFSQFGYGLFDVTFDLHRTDTPNVMTEYERNFSEQGFPIYRLVARRMFPDTKRTDVRGSEGFPAKKPAAKE